MRCDRKSGDESPQSKERRANTVVGIPGLAGGGGFGAIGEGGAEVVAIHSGDNF